MVYSYPTCYANFWEKQKFQRPNFFFFEAAEDFYLYKYNMKGSRAAPTQIHTKCRESNQNRRN